METNSALKELVWLKEPQQNAEALHSVLERGLVANNWVIIFAIETNRRTRYP
jgi:hypothetical protein